MNLYDFQKEAVDKFFNISKGRMIAALPTGTGKTIVALAIIKKVLAKNPNTKILVVVPANLRNNLIENIKKLKLNIDAEIVKTTKQLEDLYDRKNVFIISYNFLRRYIREILSYEWDMIVADEIHFAKNMNTKNFKYLWVLSNRVKYFLGLTASYVSNRLEEFFTIIALVAAKPEIIRIGNMLIKYDIEGERKASYVSKLLLNDKDTKGKLVQVGIKDPELFKRLVHKYIYLPKEEKILVVGKRPKPVSKISYVNLTEKEWKIYLLAQKKIPKPLLQLLKTNEINEDQLRQIKNQIMALQQILITPDYIYEGKDSKKPSSKVIKCGNYLKQNNSKALVFTPFLEHGAKVVYDYFKSIGIKCALYAGNVKPEERRQIQNDFENDKIDVIVLTAAGKEGINLPKANEVHFLSLTWNPEDLEQVMGRALRITSKHEKVHIFWWFALGPEDQETIDIWMSRVLERKRRLKKVIYDIISENVTAQISGYEYFPKGKRKEKEDSSNDDIIRTYYPS